jgi:amino acid transporter
LNQARFATTADFSLTAAASPKMIPAMNQETDAKHTSPVHAQLGLWDTVSVIVGIVVGSSIFKTPPIIFSAVSSAWVGLGAWALGGLLSLIGALVYAELATAYPQQGGDYVYLTRAYGSWAGFLFGWAQLTVIRSGSIGLMAFVFAGYAVDLWGLDKSWNDYLAVGAVLALAVINLLGVVLGKSTQNGLNVVKVLGLTAILAAGLIWGSARGLADAAPPRFGGFGLAMILVLYAYGGWNDAAFVAAELRNRRDIARSLILGILAITGIYLVVNAAYLMALGLDGVRDANEAVAASALSTGFGAAGKNVMCLLVMVSALGSINGMLFTGSRVYATLGAEHPLFGWLGHWHPRLGSPHWALLAQTAFTLAMMYVASGYASGQASVDRLVGALGLDPIPWKRFNNDGFQILFAATAPAFWTFFLMTGLSYFILRFREPHVERPFALPVPLNPLLPLIFCGTSLYMLHASITYAEALCVVGILPLLVGLLFYLASARFRKR